MAIDQIVTEEELTDGQALPFSDAGESPINQDSRNPFQLSHEEEGNYNQFIQDFEFFTSTGYRVLPGGAADADNVLVRVHQGITTVIYKGSAERNNRKPVVPSPDTGDPNMVLVETLFYPSSVHQEYNTTVYRASWRYKYELLKPMLPADVQSKFPIGTSPAEVSTLRSYESADFQKLNDSSAIKTTERASMTPTSGPA